MRDFAKRLVAHETLINKSSGTKTPGAFNVVDRLRSRLATLMGNGGFRALLSRALVLANADVSWLHAVNVKADGTLEGLEKSHARLDPAKFLEGKVVLLAQLLGLLVALIGPSLTLRLIGEIWPKFSFDDVDFVHGDKNEKSK